MLIFPSTSLLTGDYSIQFMETLPFSLFGPKSGNIPNSYLSLSPCILFVANPVGSIFNIHPEPNHFSPPPQGYHSRQSHPSHLSRITVLGYRTSRVFQPTLSFILSLFWLFNVESNSGLCQSILGESGSLYHFFLNLL